MSDANVEALKEWVNRVVPKDFSPGYVVLSYIISYIGAWTTLELINRRTAGKGLYNWFLLISSSVSMGGISIWCMHYIGNRAIILGGGLPALQIVYNPAFTVLSFFVPILVLLAAFMAVGANADDVSIVRVGLGGTLAGLAICGMHYLGQAGISNYTCIYQVGNVVGSAVIAIVASITALSVFFVLRSSFQGTWWKRALTAILLAGAVSGMHWLASVGTQYQLNVIDINAPAISNNSTVIVVIVLSISACFILLGFTVVAQKRRARSANRAQQVVLAAVVFDKDGRIMVTPEGLLPNTKITNSYVERSFDDIFAISHPVFQWIFRTARNWESVSGLLPAMRVHLGQTVLKASRPGTRSAEFDPRNEYGEPIEDYSIVFRELFCIAAADLASQLNVNMEDLGHVFDDILSTGTRTTVQTNMPHKKITPSSSVDLERDGLSLPRAGRGQLLLVVRRVNRKEAEHLKTGGFRFATIQNVADIVSRSMQINTEDLIQRLHAMREYSGEQPILEPGVHLACFAIRASIRAGFDILVRSNARNQLPTMQMPIQNLESYHTEYLLQLDGVSVSGCLRRLKSRSTNESLSRREQTFTAQLHQTLSALVDEINDPFFLDAALIAKPVVAPCRGASENAKPGEALVIAFRTIVPIHSGALGQKLEFTPLSFFRMQQHLYKNSFDHAVFARKIHREFGPILNQGRVEPATKSPPSANFPHRSKLAAAGNSNSSIDVRTQLEQNLPTLVPRPAVKTERSLRFWRRGSERDEAGPRKPSTIFSDTESEKNLVEQNAFGGIMVSQEVTVDSRDIRSHTPNPEDSRDDGTEMLDMHRRSSERSTSRTIVMGTMGSATTEAEDPETYVDKLFAIYADTR